MKNITLSTLFIGSMFLVPAAQADVQANYDKSCKMCHATGMAGAPKLGDKAAWGPRIAKGEAALVKSAMDGIGIMPPKGGNAAFTEADITEIVKYMVSHSK